MDYNTTQEKLRLPEYGRNVQKMAQFIMTMEDRDRRNKAASELITIMANMFPSLRESRDFKHKLWDHLAFITNFQLDIDYPVEITRPDSLPSPKLPAYNNYDIAHRHYGKIVEDLIVKAIDLEEGDEKRWLIQLIANHMKKQYIAWNKNTVNDDIIYKDLIAMSKGQLNIDTTLKIHVNTNVQQNLNAGYGSHGTTNMVNRHRTNNNNDFKRKPFQKNNNNNINRKSK